MATVPDLEHITKHTIVHILIEVGEIVDGILIVYSMDESGDKECYLEEELFHSQAGAAAWLRKANEENTSFREVMGEPSTE